MGSVEEVKASIRRYTVISILMLIMDFSPGSKLLPPYYHTFKNKRTFVIGPLVVELAVLVLA